MPKYIICFSFYKIKNHRCRITSCNKGVNKVYIYIKVQYTNCKSDHFANLNQYTLEYKAEKKAQKKTLNKGKIKIIETK